jgi:hypothetical protein
MDRLHQEQAQVDEHMRHRKLNQVRVHEARTALPAAAASLPYQPPCIL